MQQKLATPRSIVLRTIKMLLLCILVLLTASSISQAQSGRRPAKRPESPDPLPPKQEEPPVKPSSDQNSKPLIPVKVVWYLQSVSSSRIYSRIVEEGCLERLSQSHSVKATPAEDLNRKQAIDIAKASADTYVLWFELDVDAAYSGRVGIGSMPPQYLYVSYQVFTPGTGKTKTSGHVYQRQRGPGGMPLPLPGPPTPASAEYSLRYAGQEMADRLLDALGAPHPAERH